MSIRRPATRKSILEQLVADVERLGSQKALADKIGVHPSYLGDVLKGNRDIGPSILRFYGLREESVYVADDKAAS